MVQKREDVEKKLMVRWSRLKSRKGASTTEFIVILPLFFLLSLVVWQLVVAGMAVMDVQAALRDAVKFAALKGDEEKAEDQLKTSFGQNSQYSLKKYDIDIEGEEVIGKAEIEIPIIFTEGMSPITYETDSKAPVLKQFAAANAMSMLLPGNGPVLAPDKKIGCPVSGLTLTSPFNWTRLHPTLGIVRPHKGIDLGGPAGTPIYAPADGTVTYAGPAGGYGHLIVIKHDNGFTTKYGHMYSNGMFVRNGQAVKQGDPIGAVGSDGYSTGPHLHFETWYNGDVVDPQKVTPCG